MGTGTPSSRWAARLRGLCPTAHECPDPAELLEADAELLRAALQVLEAPAKAEGRRAHCWAIAACVAGASAGHRHAKGGATE